MTRRHQIIDDITGKPFTRAELEKAYEAACAKGNEWEMSVLAKELEPGLIGKTTSAIQVFARKACKSISGAVSGLRISSSPALTPSSLTTVAMGMAGATSVAIIATQNSLLAPPTAMMGMALVSAQISANKKKSANKNKPEKSDVLRERLNLTSRPSQPTAKHQDLESLL